MSDKVTVILVGGTSEIDKIITSITGGVYSHVAGILFDSVLESEGEKGPDNPYPGVWLHNIDKYKHNPYAKFIDVEVPNIDSLKEEARKLIGRPYAYLGCLEGGLYDKFGITLSIASDLAVNCSETWTRLLRAGGVDILPGIPPDDVTPNDFYKALPGNG